MDSKHRHELQRNDLAHYGRQFLGYLDKHGNAITVVICVVAIVAAGYTYWSRTTAQKAAVAWNDLEMARKSFRSDDLSAVARNYPDSDAAVWGSLLAAEQRLVLAIPGMYENREVALADLKRAREEFSAAVSHPKATAELKSRAQFGLARCLEATSGEDVSEAIKAYEAVVANNDPIYREEAEARIKVLKSDSTKEFYKWFASLNPKPPAAPVRPADRNAKSAAAEEEAKKEQDELFEKATKSLEKLTSPKKPSGDATDDTSDAKPAPADSTPASSPSDAAAEPSSTPPEPAPTEDKTVEGTSTDAPPSETESKSDSSSDEKPTSP